MILDKDTIYHFVGIKGSGMSALALILHGEGYNVQGSDVDQYFFTQKNLDEEGVLIKEFNPDNIEEGQTIIAGNAFKDDHPEIQRALEMGLKVYRYHVFLGELIKDYTSFAVTGSHGKTSTTGVLSHTLSSLAPTSYLIGDGTGYGIEDSEYFALEACEYRRHFMSYKADYAIITNVDFDHPDYYSSIDEVFEATQAFAAQTKKAVIACGEDEYLRRLNVEVPVYYYGFSDECDLYATNIKRQPDGSTFEVVKAGKNLGEVYIPLYGEHNILNTLGVILALMLAGFDFSDIVDQLKDYGGVKRRFSVRQTKDLTIIDDYAHHPREIRATIDAARQKYPKKKIVAIFQPHTFSRTSALLEEFGEALNLSDEVYLVDIFASAREQVGEITIESLQELVKGDNPLVSIDNMDVLMDYEDEVLLFMGAGDIDKLSQNFSEQYLARN